MARAAYAFKRGLSDVPVRLRHKHWTIGPITCPTLIEEIAGYIRQRFRSQVDHQIFVVRNKMQRSSATSRSATSPNLQDGKSKMPLKRVLVVGAGAAGMTCADGLAQHPDRFDVTIIGGYSFIQRIRRAERMTDAQGYCGGQAFSVPIDKQRFGVEWMNQGVQGGSYIYQYVVGDLDLLETDRCAGIHSTTSTSSVSRRNRELTSKLSCRSS